MNIDEKKIEELIEKEIKEQVANKLRLIGRKTIIEIIEDSATVVIREVLEDEVYAIKEKLEKDFMENKKEITQTITNSLVEKLMKTIGNALANETDDDYEEDCFDLHY